MKKSIFIIALLFSINIYSNKVENENLNKIEKLEVKILKLNSTKDSLSNRINEIEKNDYKSVEVIEKVNQFYDNSWNKLITFLSIAGSIILFVIPYFSAKNQREALDMKKNEFEDYTNKKIFELEEKTKKFHTSQFKLLKSEVESLTSDINTNLNNEIAFVHAMSYFLKGNISGAEKNYDKQVKNYVLAAYKLLEIKRESELLTVLTSIKNKISSWKTEGIKFDKVTIDEIEGFIGKIENVKNDNFSEVIAKMKEDYLALKK